MEVAQILKSSVLYSGTHIQKDELEKHYKRIVSNTRKFNGSLCTYKTVKSANGKQFKISYKGSLIREISFLSDRNGWEVSVTNYKKEA